MYSTLSFIPTAHTLFQLCWESRLQYGAMLAHGTRGLVWRAACDLGGRRLASLVQIDADEAHGVLTISLDNPSRRNALSMRLLEELDGCLRETARSQHRVVVLRSSCPGVFSSGHDLKEIQAGQHLGELFELCSKVMLRLRDLPQAVIGEVDGIATAAGCQLVASCDLAISSTRSRFATPGVNIGLFCSTPAVALARTVCRKHAMEMLLTGDAIDANEAFRIGLVNRVVEPQDLQVAILKLSQQISEKSGSVLALGKAAFNAQVSMDIKTAYSFAASVMVENATAGEATEGIAAFLEKRQPTFNKRRDL